MPVTKTAKRALRVSKRQKSVNSILKGRLEIAIRKVRKTKADKDARSAASIADRAVKKKLIHKNRAARIKSSLSHLVSK